MKDTVELIETLANNPINTMSLGLFVVGLILILASMGLIPKWIIIDGKVSKNQALIGGIGCVLLSLCLFFYLGKPDTEQKTTNKELSQLDCPITKDLKQAIASIKKNKQNQLFSSSDLVILETFLNQFNQYLSDERRCDDAEKINTFEEEIHYIQSFIEKKLSHE